MYISNNENCGLIDAFWPVSLSLGASLHTDSYCHIYLNRDEIMQTHCMTSPTLWFTTYYCNLYILKAKLYTLFQSARCKLLQEKIPGLLLCAYGMTCRFTFGHRPPRSASLDINNTLLQNCCASVSAVPCSMLDF